jgi:spermidine synthase
VTLALYASVVVIAVCGLVYELVAGALASYLLGDSVLQFSTVIGAYLCAMGVGSWLSRFVGKGLPARFIQIEALLGLVGGYSAALLFAAFPHVAGFRVLLYAVVAAVGALVGLEIPLLMRILKERMEFKDVVGQVLALDYAGALVASLLFPLLLIPKLGLMATAFTFGIANAGVGLWGVSVFGERLPGRGALRAQCLAVIALLVGGLVYSGEITAFAEAGLYSDEVLLARSSRYQRIVLTRWKDDVRLYLNGHLQFASRDEYRYHEALVHPALSAVRDPKRVLILGGGDGMAAREVLKDPRVGSVTLVDLDPEMTRLFKENDALASLNSFSLRSPKVTVLNDDAYKWLERNEGVFDLIVADFPDPSNFSVGKLFSESFYRMVRRRLAPDGRLVVQATSPMFARRAYWCVDKTMRAAGFNTNPYHAYVPSFGEWGFVLAGTTPYRLPKAFPPGNRFLDVPTAKGLFEFPADMARLDVESNRLGTQALVRYYEQEWHRISPD